MVRAFLVLLLLVSAATCVAGTSSALPDFGLMVNDDGDLSFTGRTPRESVANLRAMIDSLAGAPVRTLMYSVGAGSDVLYYPTTAASVWGWRKTRYNADKRWGPRIAKIKAGMAAGVDPIRVAAERAKELGLAFVPSYRMNDSHFTSDPFEYPLTGEFWVRNHAGLILGQSPIAGNENYKNLLDFSHARVREHRLAVIREIIDRYQDVMDGVELDFNRVQVLFPVGKGPERGHLITEMLRDVRARLVETGRRNGRKYHLLARVPPALKNCRWAGLLVENWMKERLVDVLMPSQLMTLAHDMPIDAFVALAKPVGAAVCPSIYPRASWSWPLVSKPSEASYTGAVSRLASPELIRGAAANYWHMGAAGFQLYNFNLPPTDTHYRVMRDLATPGTLGRADRVYAVTPAYYLDHEDTYQYRKQVPTTVSRDRAADLTLVVGEKPGPPKPDYCGLRLGLLDAVADSVLRVTLNGRVLHDGRLGACLTAVKAKVRRSGGAHPPPATAYAQFPVEDPGMLRRGTNGIVISAESLADKREITIVEVRLGMLYTRSYADMLYE